MADGRVFALGATGHTALYSFPATPGAPGAWLSGPDLPRDANGVQSIAKDAPAALLPNGRVFCVTSPLAEGTEPKGYSGPSYFFEFDGHAFTPVAGPSTTSYPAYAFRLLLLPSGQVLAANGTGDLEIYSPDGNPEPSWAPRVIDYPKVLAAGETYRVQGLQLNGLSQAVSYGDDATMATNYPLVRVRRPEAGLEWFCRTHDHQTMAVATGSAVVATNFDVPNIGVGPALLDVIANGIASEPVSVTVGSPSPKVGPSRRSGCGPNVAGGSLFIGLCALASEAVLRHLH